MIPELEISWKNALKIDTDSIYFKDLMVFLENEYKLYTVYPKIENVFRAFDLCKFYETKVIIIGQDPYHGNGQANGLCFSVSAGVPYPPSLQNIFKEVARDIGTGSNNSDLERWAKQGILLLNSVLTVRANLPNSHKEHGWERFTDSVIKGLSDKKDNLVFLLWGSYAHNKAHLINEKKHCILRTTHPSPFSAYKGFLGCSHFSQTNKYLKEHGITSIDW